MINPDEQILWEYGFFKLNLTIATTWGLMLVLVLVSWLITRRLSAGLEISRWQSVLEIVVLGIRDQIKEVGIPNARVYLPFLGTLFILIAFAGLCEIIPEYVPPTSSLSTTAALALCVFLAVPAYGIAESGLGGYLKTYLQPTFFMLPFNIISEISRTIALAIRLFGNMASGVMIASILLSIAPFLFPVIMEVLGLLASMVQAYIFAILAAVFIAAGVREGEKNKKDNDKKQNDG
ncbi:MAG: F0F1 ATP synthase subunit A [Phaeodactylibacter sp.]|nr:F0F1 ATP synthase subunit A [Phaeodactylibacter sp.]